jgi:Carboxypeptidase regulatory-like domain/TonB dependent receptor/TonB-dependent Receptor Plug Domain
VDERWDERMVSPGAAYATPARSLVTFPGSLIPIEDHRHASREPSPTAGIVIARSTADGRDPRAPGGVATMPRTTKLVALLLALVAGSSAARAQGVQTGMLTGFVRGSDGLSLPGATVTVGSPALQGVRTTVSDVNGAYVIRGLPPGTYAVTFEFPDMKPVTDSTVVPLGGTASLDATLTTVTAAELVNVTAETPSILTRPTGGLNLTQSDIDRLPSGRTPDQIAELAPGLTNNKPNAGQVTISGAFAWDNVFFIDGVDVNDNLFGDAENVFIEDAVEETQVLTSGISAEYGRFSGGVINIVTKRGGNDFSGTFRVNFTNPAWVDETPFERDAGDERESKLNKFYEGTLGGPIVRDKAWFFFAARDQESRNETPLPETGAPFSQVNSSTRFELKGTVTPMPNQTVQVSFVDNDQETVRPSFSFTVDPNAFENAQFPSELFVVNWNGVINQQMFGTLQYSRKDATLQIGGTSTAIQDSPFITLGVTVPDGFHYNGPYFDGTDPEERDNDQITGSLAYFLSSRRTGTHDLKAGFERFNARSVGGNSQSPSSFVFFTDYVVDEAGVPVFDAQGRLIPVWGPGESASNNWLASRGAELDITSWSFYGQDRWTPARRVTLDLGVRYERTRSEATGGIIGVDTDTFVPRLGASFDLEGTGRTIASASYAHYAGKYNLNQIGRNSSVGNPARVTRFYFGPAGVGRDFAPAYDLSNSLILNGEFPTENVFVDEGMSSPVTREFTLSLGREVGDRGVGRVMYIWRKTTNFIEDFIDVPGPAGQTDVIVDGEDFGTFDNTYYRNSDEPQRRYQALQFQGNYRFGSRLQVAGHWTVQLRNDGNFEGEATNQPALTSLVGDYVGILTEDRNFPVGRLDDFQRHKVRIWGFYDMDLGRFGSLDIAPLWRLNSATTYSLTAASVPLSTVQRARNPGYATLPGSGANGSQTLFFGERGSESFAGYALLDLGFTYEVPVWRTLRPWMKFEILNLFNNQKVITWDTTVTPDASSPLDANGLPTGYVRGARFGEATSAGDFPAPRPGVTGFNDGGRAFLMAAGVRF